jgi:CHAD domain-containing protein
VQYQLPDQLDPGDVSRRLARALTLQPAGRTSTGTQTVYDTFDGRLHEASCALVHEAGRLTLIEHGEDRAWAEMARTAARIFAMDLPEGPLRERLTALVEMRALTPVARLRRRSQAFRVLDDEGKTVVRLLVEEPRLARSRDGLLRPRLQVVAVRGYQKALRRVRRRLEDELGLAPAEVSLLDEAVSRSGGQPAGVSSKPQVPIRSDERADRVAARICRRLLEVMEANLPGALADTDIEFLHDLRVAVRRTRSLQRELRRAFPPEQLPSFQTEFRWLQAVTGPSRDLDVYVHEFDEFRAALPQERQPHLDPLRELLMQRRASERRRMVRALRSQRARRLLADWNELLEAMSHGLAATGPDSARPIAQVAGERIGRVYKQMVKWGREIDESSPPEALHELRKKGKELRYLLEFFASLYPAAVVKPMVRSLKALQDTLGRFQDRQVQAELLRSLADEVRTLDDGASALIAMGQLVERLEEQQAAARAEFAERFAAFASRQQRALVRETFA